MLDVLQEIDPTALENFKFLDLNQEKLKAKMKEKKADLKNKAPTSRASKANVIEKKGTMLPSKEKNKSIIDVIPEKDKKKDATDKKGKASVNKDGGKGKKSSKLEDKKDDPNSKTKKGSKKKEKAPPDSLMNMTLNKNADPVERIKDRSDHKSNMDSMASLHSRKI